MEIESNDGLPGIEVMALYRGVPLGVRHLWYEPDRPANKMKRAGSYTIGAEAGADAPVAYDYAGGAAHALVSPAGIDFAVNVTPRMTGEVVVDGKTRALGDIVSERGPSFALPSGAHADIACGDMRFLVRSTPRPLRLAVHHFDWRRREHAYTAASAAFLGLLVFMMFVTPPEAHALNGDDVGRIMRLVGYHINAPEPPPPPEVAAGKDAPHDPGGQGRAHAGPEGKMGDKKAKDADKRYAIKGNSTDPHLAKELAAEHARNVGVIGVINAQQGSHIASIFGRDSALGRDTEDVLGHLMGAEIGAAGGLGGVGLVGTGAGGGDTGEGTIGIGHLGTIGHGGGNGPNDGQGYGRGVGVLGTRKAKAPLIATVGTTDVKGQLDKEIIRRIIRRHINEVKYCYEGELTKNRDLAGRILTQFTIAGNGQVIASVLQSSTIGNPRVESCVVQAVRRWDFPKPNGGGIVIVSYPFVLAPAGGES